MENIRNGTGRKLATGVTILVGVALAVVGWLQLAPPSLGGHTSYAVITGNSMEPVLHGGDLAVIRRAASYREGDIAAYNSDQISNLVLHRIIGTEDERFITKGDHNDFVDVEKPTTDQLVGRLWFHIPGAGTALVKLRDPRVATPIAALVGLIALGAFGGARRRGRRGHRPAPQAPRHRIDPSSWNRGRKATLGCAVGLLVLSTTAGVFAFTTPEATSLNKTVGYRQQGSFSYSAKVDKGSVYDSSTVGTGEPVYMRVARDLNVAFDYDFDADSPTTIAGKGSLTTTLAASNGWSRTVARTAPVEISEGRLHIEQALKVDELQRLVERIQTETGVSETYYTLAFTAAVDTHGELAGKLIEESFSARLPFQLDSFQLRLDRETDAAVDDPTNSSDRGGVAIGQTARGQVVAGPLSIDVSMLRTASAVGAALALLMLLAVLAVGRRDPDVLERIKTRHDDLIVRVRSASQLGWDSAIEVQDFGSLKKLADAYETMVLHDARKDNVFFTICEAQIYFACVIDDHSDKGTGLDPTLVPLRLRDTVTFVEDLSIAPQNATTVLLGAGE